MPIALILTQGIQEEVFSCQLGKERLCQQETGMDVQVVAFTSER